MKLQEIKHKKCPICASKTTMERQDRQHLDGHWNEYIIFECGCSIHFSPNFMKEQILDQCPKHPTEIEKKKKRAEATKKITNYIKRFDVDDEFKARIEVYGLRFY